MILKTKKITFTMEKFLQLFYLQITNIQDPLDMANLLLCLRQISNYLIKMKNLVIPQRFQNKKFMNLNGMKKNTIIQLLCVFLIQMPNRKLKTLFPVIKKDVLLFGIFKLKTQLKKFILVKLLIIVHMIIIIKVLQFAQKTNKLKSLKLLKI